MSRISVRTILDVYTSSGPAPVFHVAQATAELGWMRWVLRKKTGDRQNRAPIWVSGNFLDIAETFPKTESEAFKQQLSRIKLSDEFIHTQSINNHINIIQWPQHHSASISYSPSHSMLRNGTEGLSLEVPNDTWGHWKVPRVSWKLRGAAPMACAWRDSVSPAPVYVMQSCKGLVTFSVR